MSIQLTEKIDPTQINGPVTHGKAYVVEGENNTRTHYQHRNDDGVLVWNQRRFFVGVQRRLNKTYPIGYLKRLLSHYYTRWGLRGRR